MLPVLMRSKSLLGFDLQLNHHRLQLLLRPDLWKIREPNSAGPERHRTAAFHCEKFILRVMFGHLIFVMSSYFDYARTLQLLGIIICSFTLFTPNNVNSASFRLFSLVLLSHANRLYWIGS